MKILTQSYSNPYFNIATEEYLLKKIANEFIFLYRNKKSIIVGKHQNTNAEINHQYALLKNIAIIRRISGGGTVFHDSGNLNFSFILNAGKNPVDFRKYTQPIVDFLLSLEIPAEFSSRNDIFIAKKKVSGNAEHLFKNRVLHHGTLLYNSKLKDLAQALNVHSERYDSKAIQSVRREVSNISDYLPNNYPIEEFSDNLFLFLKDRFSAEEYKLTSQDISKINNLVVEKYQTKKWNFAYSPNYHFKNKFMFKKNKINIDFEVKKGILENVFYINSTENRKYETFFHKLNGVWHYPPDIQNKLQANFNSTDSDFLLTQLF